MKTQNKNTKKQKKMNEQNSIYDLSWIIPLTIGEVFLVVYIPIKLVIELNKIDPLSIQGLMIISIIIFLFTHLQLNGIKHLSNISWRK